MRRYKCERRHLSIRENQLQAAYILTSASSIPDSKFPLKPHLPM